MLVIVWAHASSPFYALFACSTETTTERLHPPGHSGEGTVLAALGLSPAPRTPLTLSHAVQEAMRNLYCRHTKASVGTEYTLPGVDEEVRNRDTSRQRP